MEKSKACEWMDTQIWANKAMDQYIDGVYRCTGIVGNVVHVYKGLPELASAIGKQVEITKYDSNEYPYEMSFEYKGYKFYQIESSETDFT